MSVAFRRESDEEHKEPRFELPLPPGPNLVTARGLALIEAKVAELDAALAQASETEREELARTLRYWSTRKVTAVVAPAPVGDEVAFGSSVRLRLKGRERAFRIVGDDEADPAQNLLAWSAPLARAVMGAAAGDLLPFNGEDDAIDVLAVG